MTGGVSTWAHQLVSGLAEKQFVVYSVVANTSIPIRYEPPANVAHMIQVPLWGTEDNAEFNPRPGWIARRMRRPGRHFELEFLPAYAQLVVSVALGEGGPDDLVAALCALSIYADRYSLKRAMRDGRTWRLFRDTLAAHPLYQRLSTYEAIDLARSVYRYLAPLDYPAELPQVVHASAAAFCAIPAVVLQRAMGRPVPPDGARRLLPRTAVGPGAQPHQQPLSGVPVELLRRRRRHGVLPGRPGVAGGAVQRHLGDGARGRCGQDPSRCPTGWIRSASLSPGRPGAGTPL